MPTDTGETMPVEMGDVVVNFSKRILALNVTIVLLCRGVPFAVLPSNLCLWALHQSAPLLTPTWTILVGSTSQN